MYLLNKHLTLPPQITLTCNETLTFTLHKTYSLRPLLLPYFSIFALLLTIESTSYQACLLWLTLWVFSLVYHFNKVYYGSIFIILTVLLTFVCLCFFCTCKTLNFYLFFELSIPPTLFIIILYGYQPEKLSASSYLVLYTVLSSLPMLLVLLTMPAYLFYISPCESLHTIVALSFGFIVKTPIYLVHVWLPKAHTEAPVAGSMVLAGVLLKLGRYGLLVFLPMFIHSVLLFYLCLSVVGGVVCCHTCTRQ